MKLLMMAVSLCMLGAGTFCIANSTVAIGSVAFIIGVLSTEFHYDNCGNSISVRTNA